MVRVAISVNVGIAARSVINIALGLLAKFSTCKPRGRYEEGTRAHLSTDAPCHTIEVARFLHWFPRLQSESLIRHLSPMLVSQWFFRRVHQ